MSAVTYPITIYYDASCPMCRNEMEALKSRDRENLLVLVDCSQEEFETPASCPVTHEAMMQRIHAIDASGRWINSTDVFAAAYGAAGYKKIAKFWASRTLQPVFKIIYPWVADNRRWLSKTPLPNLISHFLKI